jgi:hypothetical protein
MLPMLAVGLIMPDAAAATEAAAAAAAAAAVAAAPPMMTPMPLASSTVVVAAVAISAPSESPTASPDLRRGNLSCTFTLPVSSNTNLLLCCCSISYATRIAAVSDAALGSGMAWANLLDSEYTTPELASDAADGADGGAFVVPAPAPAVGASDEDAPGYPYRAWGGSATAAA